MNPDSEMNLGKLNKKINESILRLGRNRTLKSEDYNTYILDRFCIKSTDGKWAISKGLELLECVHVDYEKR